MTKRRGKDQHRFASKTKSDGQNNEVKGKDTRLSIMATLDRVMQMEERMNDASISETTKQEVLSELAKWKMDAELIHQRKVKYTKQIRSTKVLSMSVHTQLAVYRKSINEKVLILIV